MAVRLAKLPLAFVFEHCCNMPSATRWQLCLKTIPNPDGKGGDFLWVLVEKDRVKSRLPPLGEDGGGGEPLQTICAQRC